MVKKSPAMNETWVQLHRVGRASGERNGPTPVVVPGKLHGRRSLAGKESDTTEQLTPAGRKEVHEIAPHSSLAGLHMRLPKDSTQTLVSSPLFSLEDGIPSMALGVAYLPDPYLWFRPFL